MDVSIYSLSDPNTNEIRYIGKTKEKLSVRLRSHLTCKNKSHKFYWIKSLSSPPKINLIEKIFNSDDCDWQHRERFWIAYFRSVGARLTNLDSGGNRGKSLSLETRLKMKLRTRSKELREAVAAKLRGRKRPIEFCIKFSKLRMGFKFSKESREKMSKSHMGKKLTPESIAKRTLKQKGVKRSDALKLKLSIIHLKRWEKIKEERDAGVQMPILGNAKQRDPNKRVQQPNQNPASKPESNESSSEDVPF